MTVDYILIGQGTSGTLLSWWLQQEGKQVVVIDDDQKSAASKVAAGVINPVTGRRYSTTWMADTLLPFASDTYRRLGNDLNVQLLFEKSVIDFFPSVQMRQAFVERIQEGTPYLHAFPDQNQFNQSFHYNFGCGQIQPAFHVHLPLMLSAWRQRLLQSNSLRTETFDAREVQLKKEGVQYGDITARALIFCDGMGGVNNPWFSPLPFAPNKGEALIIEAPELPHTYLFKRSQMLVPLPVQHTFWVGANYQWEYKDAEPTDAFHAQTTLLLQQWLKVPFKVLLHKAAERPATVERRPFVGLHPQHAQLGILNGMGSKGTSLAPFFARQLARHLVHGEALTPEADVQRFSRILSK